MHRLASCSLIAALSWCGVAVAVEPMATPAGGTTRTPIPAPGALQESADIERRVAGSVVSALAERFGGRAVEVRFDGVDVSALDGRRQSVSGRGGVRFAGGSAWIGFRFGSVYDTLLGQPGRPQVEIGVGGEGRSVPNDGLALRQLEDRMTAMLQDARAMPSVRLQLDRVETFETGQYYLSMDAEGLVDFGLDGSRGIRVRALNDRRDGQWLQLDYDLGAAAGEALVGR